MIRTPMFEAVRRTLVAAADVPGTQSAKIKAQLLAKGVSPAELQAALERAAEQIAELVLAEKH